MQIVITQKRNPINCPSPFHIKRRRSAHWTPEASAFREPAASVDLWPRHFTPGERQPNSFPLCGRLIKPRTGHISINNSAYNISGSHLRRDTQHSEAWCMYTHTCSTSFHYIIDFWDVNSYENVRLSRNLEAATKVSYIIVLPVCTFETGDVSYLWLRYVSYFRGYVVLFATWFLVLLEIIRAFMA